MPLTIERLFLSITVVQIFELFRVLSFFVQVCFTCSILIWDFQVLNLLLTHIHLSAGLELLLELLESTSLKQQHDGSMALYKLATKATSLSPVDAAPPSPNPQVVY